MSPAYVGQLAEETISPIGRKFTPSNRRDDLDQDEEPGKPGNDAGVGAVTTRSFHTERGERASLDKCSRKRSCGRASGYKIGSRSTGLFGGEQVSALLIWLY